MKEGLDERSDVERTEKFLFSLILNGSSIFREATSPFDRATMFCGDFSLIFLLLFLFLWEKMGGEKQTHTHKLYTTTTHRTCPVVDFRGLWLFVVY